MEEACGVYAVLAAGQPVANLTYFGLYALQHRGQESAGIAVFNEGKVRLHKDMGLVSQVFDQDVLARMPGDLGHRPQPLLHDRQQQGLQCPARRVDDPAWCLCLCP